MVTDGSAHAYPGGGVSAARDQHVDGGVEVQVVHGTQVSVVMTDDLMHTQTYIHTWLRASTAAIAHVGWS